MCGIAGFYGMPDWDLTELMRMTASLAHRGPDDAGYYLDRKHGVGLGHRRLSVLDLSKAGHQPMTYEDSGYWITYNGEVYNFIELRNELERKGYQFYSNSDTEVVLASYLAWGIGALSRFNGMWAFAIFDQRRSKLTLCRDRYGVKPLYYHHCEGARLAFASECKAFWAVGDELRLRWDERGLKTALINPFQLESSGQTYFRHVHNLAPGHMLTVTGGHLEVSQWWNTLDHLHEVPNDFDEQCTAFKDLFDDACRIRMRSDVRVGTSLSGGLDSSSVLSSLSRIARASPHSGARISTSQPMAFIHSFPDTFLDETTGALQAAISAGADYRLIAAEAGDFAQHLDDILYSLEGIFGGMLDGPWRIYRAQRQCGIAVSVDGHGADELLGGYWWHPPFALKDAKPWSRRYWKTLMLEKEIYGDNLPRHFLLNRILESSGLQKSVRWLDHHLGVSFGHGPKVPSFLSAAAEEVAPYSPRRVEASDEFDHLGMALYDDFHNGVLPRILKNFDAMSMAHGVEVRTPFLDYRLVNFAFSLPSTSKIDRGYTKLILRNAMIGVLPNTIRLSRSKIGFTSPVANWFRDVMRPWIEDSLSDPTCDSDLIDKDRLRCAFEVGLRADQFDWAEALEIWKYLSALKLQAIVTLSHGRETTSHLTARDLLNRGEYIAGPTTGLSPEK